MSYQRLGPLNNGSGDVRYKVTITMFRDCSGNNAEFAQDISVGVYYDNTNKDRLQEYIFEMKGTPQGVKPPGNVDCDFWPRKVCIQRAVYEEFIDLPVSTVGYHIIHKTCCRNTQENLIDDASGTPFQGQTYYAFVPPLNIENSSPEFRGVPSPFMCSNDTTSFFYIAFDRDGDSLVYKLANPWQGASRSQAEWSAPNFLEDFENVEYVNGYSWQKPFGQNGYATVDSETGITEFYTPPLPAQSRFVVAVDVSEYRDGELLSTVRLDLQIIVIDCPPNKRPEISSAGGSENEFTVMAGEEICFDIDVEDPDGDGMKLVEFGEIFEGLNGYDGPEPTLNPKTGVGQFTSRFCWRPDCDMASDEPYIFTVQVEDDGCPPKFNNAKFSITVLPFEGADSISGPDTVCAFSDGHVYQAENPGSDQSTFSWQIQGGEIIGSSTDQIVLVRWLDEGIGTLTLVETSANGCVAEPVNYEVSIQEAPPVPLILGDMNVCEQEAGVPYAANSNQTFNHFWNVEGGTFTVTSSTGIEVDWGTQGDGVITLQVENEFGCLSDTARYEVTIHKPQPQIFGPISVCPNAQDIQYQVNNPNSNSTYTWQMSGGVPDAPSNGPTLLVDWGNEGNGSVEVVETDQYGCVSEPTILLVVKEYNLQLVVPNGPQDVCEFETGVPYQVPASFGSTYNWSIVGGSQVFGNTTAYIQVDWGAAGNGEVTVFEEAYDAVNDSACKSDPVTLDVTIHPNPVADLIEGPDSICQTVQGTYRLNGFPGSYYLWSIDGDTSGISGQGSNEVTIEWNSFGTFQLSVLEITDQGCSDESVDTLITVHPKPDADRINGETVACIDFNLNDQVYTINGFPNSTYTWMINNGQITQGQGSNSITVNWQPDINNGNLTVVEESDKGCLGDTIDLSVFIDRARLDLDVVSVGLPDDFVTIDWSYPNEGVILEGLTLQKKSSAPDSWSGIANLNSGQSSFVERPLNTDITSYSYRLIATNLCDQVIRSDEHTTVLLTGRETGEFQVQLDWTRYAGWDEGVDFYEVYEKKSGEGYLPVGVVTGNNSGAELSFITDEDGESYERCFRIKAYELNGKQKVSFSNEICFSFDPRVYVPSAFTPNDDNLNDVFRPVIGAVKTYEMNLYNRWGELIYSTKNIEDGWDGTVNNKPAQDGVYVYLIKFGDHNDKIYQLNGTFHLHR
jgi:gliding motility-associated-like protein